jgi:hypothetical protein
MIAGTASGFYNNQGSQVEGRPNASEQANLVKRVGAAKGRIELVSGNIHKLGEVLHADPPIVGPF